MLLRRVVLLAVLALAIVPTAAAASMSKPEGAILREMNRVRAQHGLKTLRFDGRLERASRSYSHTMLRTGAFTHGAFASRMARFQVQGSLAGENLAWGVGFQATPRGIVAGWLASPEHRANLLRASFRRIGIGSLVGPFAGFDGATVVTADFAG